MNILPQSYFNEALSLFFLAKNLHACRRVLEIIDSSAPFTQLITYLGVEFTTFKFVFQNNEISPLEHLQELNADDLIEIELSSNQLQEQLRITVSYACFKSLRSCFAEDHKVLEGTFKLGLSYELKDYAKVQYCPYCNHKLQPYGQHVKIVKALTEESDVLFSLGYEFKSYPVSLPRMMCSNAHCSEKLNRYRERHNDKFPDNLEDEINITHVLFVDLYTPFYAVVAQIANRIVELALGQSPTSVEDEAIIDLYPCQKYNLILRYYEKITKLLDLVWYRAKFNAKSEYLRLHKPGAHRDIVLRTEKFAKLKIKKFTHRLKILLNHFVLSLTTYSQLRTRSPPHKIPPTNA